MVELVYLATSTVALVLGAVVVGYSRAGVKTVDWCARCQINGQGETIAPLIR